MKAFLKSSRKAGSKKYLGVIGSYLFEIIDQEPLIMKVLLGTKSIFNPSQASRHSGPEKRMILTTFSSDALLIFKTAHENALGDLVDLTIFLNASTYDIQTLLQEAEMLAILRWPIATLRFECSTSYQRSLFIKAGWKSSLTANRFTVEKFISANGKKN